MKWKHIKKAGLTTIQIAKELGYKDANTFRNSSKYKRIMGFLDHVILNCTPPETNHEIKCYCGHTITCTCGPENANS